MFPNLTTRRLGLFFLCFFLSKKLIILRPILTVRAPLHDQPLHDHYLTITWSLIDHYLTITWSLLDHYMTITWPLLDHYLTITWLLLDHFLTNFRHPRSIPVPLLWSCGQGDISLLRSWWDFKRRQSRNLTKIFLSSPLAKRDPGPNKVSLLRDIIMERPLSFSSIYQTI